MHDASLVGTAKVNASTRPSCTIPRETSTSSCKKNKCVPMKTWVYFSVLVVLSLSLVQSWRSGLLPRGVAGRGLSAAHQRRNIALFEAGHGHGHGHGRYALTQALTCILTYILMLRAWAWNGGRTTSG